MTEPTDKVIVARMKKIVAALETLTDGNYPIGTDTKDDLEHTVKVINWLLYHETDEDQV